MIHVALTMLRGELATPLVPRLGDNHRLWDLEGAAGGPSRIVRPGYEPMDQTFPNLVEVGGENKRSAHTLF